MGHFESFNDVNLPIIQEEDTAISGVGVVIIFISVFWVWWRGNYYDCYLTIFRNSEEGIGKFLYFWEGNNL
jgi:hypothetical protein